MQSAPVRGAAPLPERSRCSGFLVPDEGDGRPRRTRAGSIRALDVGGIASSLPYDVFPLPLQLAEQTPPQPGRLPAPVPLPELSEGPHLSYAIQWFSFAAIAVVGAVILLRAATGAPLQQALDHEAGRRRSRRSPARPATGSARDPRTPRAATATAKGSISVQTGTGNSPPRNETIRTSRNNVTMRERDREVRDDADDRRRHRLQRRGEPDVAADPLDVRSAEEDPEEARHERRPHDDGRAEDARRRAAGGRPGAGTRRRSRRTPGP